MRFTITTVSALGFILAVVQTAPTGPPPTASSVQRIIGGTKVNGRAYPFAAVLNIVVPGGVALCGGSLIADNYILTAAHCITDEQSGAPTSASAVVAGLGSNNVEKAELYQASKISVHPGFDTMSLANDVALVQLKKSAKLDDNTQIVKLTDSKIKDNQVLQAIGWGKVSNAGSVSDDLRQVNITVGPTSKCREAEPDFKDQSGPTICAAKNDNHDTCQGDSGGALVYSDGKSFQLAGLTSYGFTPGSTSTACGTSSVVAFYTRPAYFADWISKTTGIKKDTLLA
ncbi:hypothetical protein IWQ60_007663 [Tieghemiomyces parasiticus]|uniref:Peptidase S1 domain-containing protein n=1 Tax=Tieghemiomyces parasiticus TaxID=78921 RepID=A0A9W8A2L4_9FUNG|nr:hypothetical protein IWQ60_007663 [Tieghemiomyces parasiticus]